MKRGSIFETDGIPRMSEALPLAMQHVVAMIVGCVTPAIIVSGAVPGGWCPHHCGRVWFPLCAADL